jgi:transposase
LDHDSFDSLAKSLAGARTRHESLERLSNVVPIWHSGRMQRPHASDDVRERALAAVDAGHRVADVATYFGNDPSTIYRWLRQRRRTGSGLARPRSGRPRLLTAVQLPDLEAQVAATPDATLADHCAQWAAGGRVRPSLSTMSRWLRDVRFTLKKRA